MPALLRRPACPGARPCQGRSSLDRACAPAEHGSYRKARTGKISQIGVSTLSGEPRCCTSARLAGRRPARHRGPLSADLTPLRNQRLVGTSHPAQFRDRLPPDLILMAGNGSRLPVVGFSKTESAMQGIVIDRRSSEPVSSKLESGIARTFPANRGLVVPAKTRSIFPTPT
jgi:hypothetical protein